MQTSAQAPRVESVIASRVVAGMVVALAVVAWTVDPDLWGHLRYGLDVIRDRALPRADPYAFTADLPWVNHEWLSEAILGAGYQTGGVPALLAVKVAVLLTAYAAIAWRLRAVAEPARWWLLTLAIVVNAPATVSWRPQIWTIAALSLLLATFDAPRGRRLLCWPLLFTLWANLHGGWIVGLAVIGARTLGQAMDSRDWRTARGELLVIGVCAIATLATPYGLELWRFIWTTVGVQRDDIVDWQPIWRHRPAVAVTLWSLVAVPAAMLLRVHAWRWAAVVPVALLAVGGASVNRLIGPFGLAVVLLLGPQWRQARAPAVPRVLIGIIAAVALAPACWLAWRESRCLPVNVVRSDALPDRIAAGALRGATGRLMVPFNWGQYAIWHFGPSLKVSNDGRRETVYSPAVRTEQLWLDFSDPRILPFIGRERPEYVWVYWPQGKRLAHQLRDVGYRQDVITDRSSIFVRGDVQRLVAAAPMPACFP